MRGVTLIEVLVVLTLMGLVVGVSGVALSSLRPQLDSAKLLELRKGRMDAIRSGAPRTAHGVRFLPDGRAVGEGVDPLTGMAR